MDILFRHSLFPGFAGGREAACTILELIVAMTVLMVLLMMGIGALVGKHERQNDHPKSTITHLHGAQAG